MLTGTIFEYNNKTPVSVLLMISKLWLGNEKNVLEIKNKLIEIYHLEDLNVQFIYKFLSNCLKKILLIILDHYMY